MVKTPAFPLYCLNIPTTGKVDEISVIDFEPLGNFTFRCKNEIENGDVAKNLLWRHIDREKYNSLFYSSPLTPSSSPSFTTVLVQHSKKNDGDLSYPWSLDSSESLIFTFDEDISEGEIEDKDPELSFSPPSPSLSSSTSLSSSSSSSSQASFPLLSLLQPSLQKLQIQHQKQETNSYMHRIKKFLDGEDEDDLEDDTSLKANNQEKDANTVNRPLCFIPIEFRRNRQNASNANPAQYADPIELQEKQKTGLKNTRIAETKIMAENSSEDTQDNIQVKNIVEFQKTLRQTATAPPPILTSTVNNKKLTHLNYSSNFTPTRYNLLNDPQLLLNEAKMSFIPKTPLSCNSDSYPKSLEIGVKMEQTYQQSLIYLRNSTYTKPHDELPYHVW